MVSGSFSTGLLVGFLDVGRHLASVFFFVRWITKLDFKDTMPAWSRNWTLRRIPAWNKPDFKSADFGYNEEGKFVSSALGLGLVLRLGLGYADMASCSFCVELWMISLFDFWVNFFHFIQFIQHAIQLGDPELVIWGFEGPRRDWIGCFNSTADFILI
ncbi:unnamed protein product [Rhizophagus irregularis]|nr:unnamed protein product [Rhizophagus irregularis]